MHSLEHPHRSASRYRRLVALALSLALAAPIAGVGFASEATLAPTTVSAQQRAVRAEVLVILAKEDNGTVDPSLNGIAALQRPPFNSFRSMRVLDRPHVNLRPDRDADITLPNGRQLRIRLQQQTPDGRYRVRVSINRPNESDYLPLLQVLASPGDPFFVAGQAHDGGTLVIGITLR